MKKIFAIICCLCLSFTSVLAQTERNEKVDVSADSLKIQNNQAELLPADSIEFSLISPIPSTRDFLPFNMYGISPLHNYGYNSWELHKGFNASFGMNVSVGLGKNSLHGVGFGQDAAFLYAVPLNNRLSVAGGVYATNMNWGNYQYKNVGIAGIAAYKLTDKVTLYGYGNKSIMPKKRFPTYPLPNFTPDKFGGMVNFKVGESASISVGVEAIKNNNPYYYLW